MGSSWESGEQRAQYAVRRCTEGDEIPADLRPCAQRVVLALLLAGLSMYDNEMAADGEDSGVELAVADPAEHGAALQAVWRQRQGNMLAPPWRAVQTTMHEVLRAILTVNGFQVIQGRTPSSAPIVIADPLNDSNR